VRTKPSFTFWSGRICENFRNESLKKEIFDDFFELFMTNGLIFCYNSIFVSEEGYFNFFALNLMI